MKGYKMKLKQIYKKAKKINPLYKSTFEDFILDFSNCRECFFKTIKDFRKYGLSKNIDIELHHYYIKFYK